MYRIFCNDCYTLFNKDRSFSLTSCGHVYCSNCLPYGNRDNCKICKRKFSKMIISKQMPESTQMLFKDLKRNILSFQKVIRFQTDQNEYLIQHLSKENGRLKRLVSCFKKRIDFLRKNSSVNVTRQMYTTIKQEPIDDDYNEYPLNGKITTGVNGGIKSSEFDNVDWNDDMDTDDYEKKTRQYMNSKNFIPQMKNFPEKNGNGLESGMRKMGIDVTLNNLTKMNKQRISVAQDLSKVDDIKQWNYPQAIFPLNIGSGTEEISKPQPTRQSTMDQFLLRGNNFIDSVMSHHFPLNNQTIGHIGPINYPNTVLATRPIDAKTLNRDYGRQ